jgi:peptidoglycan hydrolase-like protein with peptidoglycan-binding domain
VGLAVVVATSLAGWAAGRQIRSPAELAARRAPPSPSPIAVPVEKRQLSSDVVVRGTVRYGVPQVVSLPTSALKPAKAIVTTAPVKGRGLREGDVALVLSGRPVFVLQGAGLAYRDIGPGAVGDDVRQLQEALLRLGFDPGATDGVYSVQTQHAVAAWYEAAGWVASGPTDEQLSAQRAAASDEFSASSDVLAAEEGLAAARGALAVAQEQAQAAQTAAQAAPIAEAAAQAKADQERHAADAEIATRAAALDAAVNAKKVAQLQLDEARVTDPRPSAAAMAILEAAVSDAAGAINAARAELAAAQATAAAVDVVPFGTLTAGLTRAVDAANAEVGRANAAVRLAQGRLTLVTDRETATRADLQRGGARLGVQVPADEVLFFPNLPQRIDDVTVTAGAEVSGPVMTVSNFELAIDAALSSDDAKLVRTGAPVAIDAPDLGVQAKGTVTEVAKTPGTKGVDPQRFYLGVSPVDAPAGLIGASVVLTITVSSTAGEILAVPVAALSMAADGTTRVAVQQTDGSTRQVTVTPGLAAKGLVAVTPDGALAAGDLVVVGVSGGTTPGAAASTTTAPVTTATPRSTNAP